MRVDANAYVGGYPFRRVPGSSADALTRALLRLRIDEAWVSHLPAIFWRDPTEGNAWLYETVTRASRFRAVPCVHPGLANWREELDGAMRHHAAAVRVDPTVQGIDPVGEELRQLAAECGERRLPLMLTVRFEDGRQRHSIDGSAELPPAAVRAIVRSDAAVKVLVTHADRGFIEEVHWSLTPDESKRVWWDISWIWGPPEDHLVLLLETMGSARFVFGTGQPLRLPEAPIARLDLLDLDKAHRGAIESGNAATLAER
jgi:predicted TIM-barrel fold metal-dependent hydrolase